MKIKYVIFATLISLVATESRDYRCSQRSALKLIKKPVYTFSVKLLQRVAENSDSHFVFSPISTWIQLSAVADGATGTTFTEIWNVTRHFRPKCFKQKQAMILKNTYRNINAESRSKSVIVIDKLMGVKKSYIKKIERFYGIEVLLLDFKHAKSAAKEVNDVLTVSTGGAIEEIVYFDDFFYRVMILCDANYFKLDWKFPFNSAYTTIQPFYSSEYKNVTTGKVKMMNQIGYFNITDFPILDATVLELPCEKYFNYVSMLVFLPRRRLAIKEMYYKLERTRLTPIFKQFEYEKEKLVNVSLPKFKQWTETENLAELIYDMGVQKVFDPYEAKLHGISNGTMYASFMTQVTHIDVDEKGITAGSVANLLIHNDTSIEFLVNRPFVYMIVDKETEFILFSGIYSSPSVV